MTMNKILCFIFAAFAASVANAIEITRYVAQGATGDGLTKESPAGDLKKVLDLSKNVDGLTVYLEPGQYELPPLTDVNSRTRYNNVCIYGGGCQGIAKAESKSVIKGDLSINGGAVLNVNFIGSRIEDKWSPNVLEGSLHVIGCNLFYTNATQLEVETANGNDLSLIEVSAKSMSLHPWRQGDPRSTIHALGCIFDGGEGASFSGVCLQAVNCSFSLNKDAAGISLNRCTGSVLQNCQIIGNNGFGGITVTNLTDDIDVVFDRCIISRNTSTRDDHSSAITTRTPILLRSCLVSGNYSDLKAKGASYHNQYQGAIELCRRASRFENCTFTNNKDAVIYYSMEAGDHDRIGTPNFINCIFLSNGKPYVSTSGKAPLMGYCAADFGSDIPELDAERHMMRITEQSSGMSIYKDMMVELNEGSPLINAGLPTTNLDLNGNCHLMLGGTDLGCAEYTGDWTPVNPSQQIEFGGTDYSLMESTYKSEKYFAYMPGAEPGINITNCIYAGNNASPCQIKDNSVIATYMNFGDSHLAILYQIKSSIWGTNDYLSITGSMPYKTALPKPEKVDGRWILKEPAVKKTTSTAKRGAQTKRTTSAKRRR